WRPAPPSPAGPARRGAHASGGAGLDASIGMTESLQHWVMRSQGAQESAVVDIGELVLAGDVAHDAAQGGVVHAGHARKKMMLDLVIESADIPGQKRVPVREIGRRGKLVGDPAFTHGSVRVGERVGDAFDNVGQLKDESEYQAG